MVGTKGERKPKLANMTKKKHNILGFGYNPDLTEHYFLVTIPASQAKGAEVMISEHFEWQQPEKGKEIYTSLNNENAHIKVILKRFMWDDIAEETKAEFNRRLRAYDTKTGKWKKKGQIHLERTLGKELVLLAWTIEDCDPVLISTAVRNWLGLAPEERWWLYTITNAATGHALNDRMKGWRRAIRFALTENPVFDQSLLKRRENFSSHFLAERTSIDDDI